MIADEFNLANAQSQYAVANTPLFLLRKLQEDGVVKSISDKLSGEKILHELGRGVTRQPDDLFQAVLPYVCLVALWMKPDASFLQRATEINPMYHDDWFRIVRQALIQTYNPTSRQVIQIPVINAPKPRFWSNSAVTAKTIKLSDRTG